MENLGFWAAVAAISAVVGASLALVLLRREPAAAAETDTGAVSGAAQDARIYRDQLAEIDRDLVRGTIQADEAGRLRAEVARRLLEADRAARADAGTGRAARVAGGERGTRLMAALVVAVAVFVAVWVYLRIGAPGYPDLPLAERIAMSEELRKTRPSQAEAEAQAPAETPRADVDPEFLTLMERLREAVAANPQDVRGLELLARNEAALGNLRAAKTAQEQLVAARGDAVTAEDLAALAEIMILVTGGYVSPEAEAALIGALQRDSGNGTAIYYSGLMALQIGRPDQTFRLWRPLLEKSPPEAPWVDPIRAQIEEVAWRAGVDYTLPPAAGAAATAPGPDSADMEAAAGMSEEDRAAMIEGMVAQLSERLQAEGGSPDEWARLIRALGVLGRTDAAKAALAQAEAAFTGDVESLSMLRAVAAEAGVAP